MYLLESNIETNVLRQGDIVSEVQYLGCINLNNILMHYNTNGEKESWSFKIPPIIGPAMVISHSCELDHSNGIKITSIILCPLRDINKATSPDKIEELKSTNLISEDTETTYLKYFYIQPHSYLPFPDGAIVDFSKCFSVHKSAYENLVSKKVLQLNSDVANNMALKFSLYFYRRQNTA